MDQLLTIQQLSRSLKIPKPTLRFWEKELAGIISPLRTKGGQRRYTSDHAAIIAEIHRFRTQGLSLEAIRQKFAEDPYGNISVSELNHVDLLAEKVAEIVKREIYSFFEGKKFDYENNDQEKF